MALASGLVPVTTAPRVVAGRRADRDEAFVNAPSRTERFPLAEAPELARAVTPTGLDRLRVHRWGWLAHSFGPALVTWAGRRLGLRPGSVVLDPFVGAGTTLVAGRRAASAQQ